MRGGGGENAMRERGERECDETVREERIKIDGGVGW